MTFSGGIRIRSDQKGSDPTGSGSATRRARYRYVFIAKKKPNEETLGPLNVKAKYKKRA